MWMGQCTSHTLLRSIKRTAWSLPVFSDSLLSPQGWGVQGSEWHCRWGSLWHIKGGWKWSRLVGGLAFKQANSSLPMLFLPLPLSYRFLLQNPPVITHIVTGWLILPEKYVCQHLDHYIKPQCLLQLEWEIVTLDMQVVLEELNQFHTLWFSLLLKVWEGPLNVWKWRFYGLMSWV